MLLNSFGPTLSAQWNCVLPIQWRFYHPLRISATIRLSKERFSMPNTTADPPVLSQGFQPSKRVPASQDGKAYLRPHRWDIHHLAPRLSLLRDPFKTRQALINSDILFSHGLNKVQLYNLYVSLQSVNPSPKIKRVSKAVEPQAQVSANVSLF